MKNMIKIGRWCAFATILGMAACSNQDDDSAKLVVRLTDSPGDFQEVNVEIIDVQVNAEDGEGEDGWESLPNVNTGVYNLLDLTGGTETVLSNSSYPPGMINQIRLLLGDDNSVKIDGQRYELNTPSGQQSGLKLRLNAELTPGITYTILLDFDAAQSVVKTASGNYNLKPVIKLVSEAQDGAISGTVIPETLSVAVFAISDQDTLGSSFVPAGSHELFLGGLPAGSYTISFDPGQTSGYQGYLLENVVVNLGEVTNVGVVSLSEL